MLGAAIRRWCRDDEETDVAELHRVTTGSETPVTIQLDALRILLERGLRQTPQEIHVEGAVGRLDDAELKALNEAMLTAGGILVQYEATGAHDCLYGSATQRYLFSRVGEPGSQCLPSKLRRASPPFFYDIEPPFVILVIAEGKRVR